MLFSAPPWGWAEGTFANQRGWMDMRTGLPGRDSKQGRAAGSGPQHMIPRQ